MAGREEGRSHTCLRACRPARLQAPARSRARVPVVCRVNVARPHAHVPACWVCGLACKDSTLHSWLWQLQPLRMARQAMKNTGAQDSRDWPQANLDKIGSGAEPCIGSWTETRARKTESRNTVCGLRPYKRNQTLAQLVEGSRSSGTLA